LASAALAAPPVAAVHVAAAPVTTSFVAAASACAATTRSFHSHGCCTLSNGNGVTDKFSVLSQ